MAKPVAVIISDTHYSLSTKDLADKAWRMAVDKATELGVDLIDAGDITNDKDILRAQVLNTMVKTLQYARDRKVQIYCIVGNHSLVNEKSKENALEFLKPYAIVVDRHIPFKVGHLIPYHSDLNDLKVTLDTIPKGSTIIMHQGVTKAWGGHYMYDKTAAPAEWFADFRVISGHYHRRQDIKCGPPRKGAVGLFSYVGNPYTLTFGEAHDGPKGFQILMDDGTLEFVPTNLRKHVVIETEVGSIDNFLALPVGVVHAQDLVWIKIKGPKSRLADQDKETIGMFLMGHANYKLDLIPTDTQNETKKAEDPKMTDLEVLKKLIDGLPDNAEYREYLKQLVDGVLDG